MFGTLWRKRDWIRILVGFAPNLATPQLILLSPRYYAWWLDEFLGNFSKVNKIDLRITVNRTQNPNHDINFMKGEVKKHGLYYKGVMKNTRHWHSLMEVFIRRADSEDVAKEGELAEKTPKQISNGSVADELAKLGELQKQGLLTNEEFLSQKTKLLS